MKKEWTKYAVSIAVCIAAIAVTVTTSVFFIKRVEDVAISEKMNYLNQISSQGTDVVTSKLVNGVSVVNSVARYMEGEGGDIFSEHAINGIHNVAVKSDFENMSLVDKNGVVYHTINDVPINIADRYYFSRFMAGDLVISNVVDARDDGTQAVVLGAPISMNGVVIGGVIARYPATSIDKMLEKNLSDNDIRCYIVHSDGDVFAAAKIDSGEKRMTNIMLDLQQLNKKNSPAMLNVKSDMMNSKKGCVEIDYLGKKFLLSYEPIGINDLYCTVMMPYDKTITNIEHTTDTVIWCCMICLVVLISLLLYFVIAIQKRRHEFEMASGELDIIYQSVPSGMFKCSCDSAMRVSFANDYFYSLMGISEKNFIDGYDKNFSRLIEGGSEDIVDCVSSGGIITVEKRILSDDEDKWCCISGRAVKNSVTGDMELFCTMTDTTMQHKMYDELHMQEERCALMLEQVKDIIFEWNYDSNEMFYSKYFDEKFGYTPVVSDFPDGFIHLGIVYREDRQVFLNLFKTINMGSSYSEDEIRIRKNDGGYLWCKICIMAVRDERNILHRIIGMISDIDAQKRETDEIKESAKRDSLTTLYNKGATEELINESLNNTNCGQCAFLMIDIDNFKSVNDTMGHNVGDEVLKELSLRIQGLFRDGDIIGRIGGDEFVVFMRNITSEQIADYKAKCVVQALKYTASNDDGASVSITGSVGIAYSPKDAKTYTQLYSKADKALYYSKKNGKSQVSVYNSSLE